ncbi:MAPEG family protein [Bradyrhizobium tropiciagri]|uniref:MAPEG family protein n=1 Tax=Bradyrhizobium tropiciagri TaxID=312253 RepID=UPI001BA7FE11|nr:MAPEG family protein [Bradyrhizobium tropiciagri]MBR0895141.1 MAPEG family protein [Bradyrhizobium tropiciagri]
MNNLDIIRPAIVLALFTLAVLLLMGIRRGLSKETTADDYRFGESHRVPPSVSVVNRNYMNLLELPVLFYAASLLILILQRSDTVFVGLAWTYVALRIGHSAVHLTYNRVLHRLLIFVASNVVLVVMWLRILFMTW